MAKRRRSRATLQGVTYDAMGNVTGTTDDAPDPAQDRSTDWMPTANPDIVKKVVPAGTMGATDAGAVSVSMNFPAGYDTWYKPTPAAYAGGRAQAALDTIQATATQIAATGGFLLGNMGPLLLGGVVLYLWLNFGKR